MRFRISQKCLPGSLAVGCPGSAGTSNQRRIRGSNSLRRNTMQTSTKKNDSTGSFWSVRHIGLLALIVAVMLGMATISGNAQSITGTILGTIADQSGAVLPNTTVQLINQGTNTKVQTESNDSGYYQFVAVPPATYKIVVQKEGFKQLSRAGIVLQTEARIQVDLALQIGASTETVEVSASSPLIEADAVSLGTVVDQRETNELPLNGRNPMNLTALVASVIPLGQTSGTPTGVNPIAWGNYQIGGGMAGQNSTYVDGSPDNGIYFHNTEFIPSQDSIQEFKVETNNLSAEYGALAGGAINFTTKSGGKDLHASAWEFIRNKVLNANDYYSNHNNIPRGPFTQNQYGFNIGGPVVLPHLYYGRKRTFFFFNWEGFGLRQGLATTTTVPPWTEISTGDLSVFKDSNGNPYPLYDPLTPCSTESGIASPGSGIRLCNPGEVDGSRLPLNGTGTPDSIVPTGRMNSTAVKYLAQFMPAPTLAGATLNNYTSKVSSGGNNYQTVVKMDHDFSDKNHVMSRYTYWKNSSLPVDPLKTGICANGSCAEIYHVQNFILDDTVTLSAKSILDVRLSYGRYSYNRTPLRTDFDVTKIDWPASYQALVEFPGPPVMVIPTFDQAGLFGQQGADSSIFTREDTGRLAGTFTRFVGNHTLKLGGEYTLQRFAYAQTNTSSGLWNFSAGATSCVSCSGSSGLALASYLLGYPSGGGSWYENLSASALHYPGVFATDDWRASKKLAFHLGIRWEDSLPYTERHDRISYFDYAASNDVLTAYGIPNVKGNINLVNTPARSSRYGTNPDDKMISPRAGVSYRIAPNTVFTAGYGIFWLLIDVTTSQNPGWDGTSGFTTPYVGSTNGYTPTNSISTPYPLSNPADPSSAYIVMPAGRSKATASPVTGLFQYQVNTLGNGVTGTFPNDPWGYTQQWNAGIQQQIGKSSSIAVSYAGSRGAHLPFGGIQMDQISDSVLATAASQYQAHQTPAIAQQVTNPYYDAIPAGNPLKVATVSYGQTILPYPQYAGVGSGGAHLGDSTYNALEVKLTKRFSQGASFNVAYTFSKMISDTDTLASWLESISGIQDANNLKGEKSVSSTSTPQRLVIAY